MVAASSPALHACLAHADTTPEHQLPILVSGLRQQQTSTREANELKAQALPRRGAADLHWNPQRDRVSPEPNRRSLEQISGHCWKSGADATELCFLFDPQAQSLTQHGCFRGRLVALHRFLADADTDSFGVGPIDGSILLRQRTFSPPLGIWDRPLYDQRTLHQITASRFMIELRTWQDQTQPFEDRTRRIYHHTRAINPRTPICDRIGRGSSSRILGRSRHPVAPATLGDVERRIGAREHGVDGFTGTQVR
jgi:hypothetical protein